MASFVSITIDPLRLQAVLDELKEFPGETEKVLAKAINAAATVGQSAIMAGIAADVAIDNPKIIKRRVIRRGGNAKPDSLSTQIVIKGDPIGLTSFRWRFVRDEGQGVQVQIMRGRVIRFPHAFAGIGPLGKLHIMESSEEEKKFLFVHYKPNFGRVARVPASRLGSDLVSIIEANADIMNKPFEAIYQKLESETAAGLDRVLNKGLAKTTGIAGLIHKAATAIYTN